MHVALLLTGAQFAPPDVSETAWHIKPGVVPPVHVGYDPPEKYWSRQVGTNAQPWEGSGAWPGGHAEPVLTHRHASTRSMTTVETAVHAWPIGHVPPHVGYVPPPTQTDPSAQVQSGRQLPGHAVLSVPSHASVASRTLLPHTAPLGHVQSD